MSGLGDQGRPLTRPAGTLSPLPRGEGVSQAILGYPLNPSVPGELPGTSMRQQLNLPGLQVSRDFRGSRQ
jgi:hypothetical protein